MDETRKVGAPAKTLTKKLREMAVLDEIFIANRLSSQVSPYCAYVQKKDKSYKFKTFTEYDDDVLSGTKVVRVDA